MGWITSSRDCVVSAHDPFQISVVIKFCACLISTGAGGKQLLRFSAYTTGDTQMFRKLTIALASGAVLAAATAAFADEGYIGNRAVRSSAGELGHHQVQPFTANEKAWFDRGTGSVDTN